MKCEHCDKPATVHVTHVANGKVVKTHLCEECAAGMGVAKSVSALAETLLGPVSPVLPTRAISCPACGLSVRKFQKEGRLGCPECYQVFSREIVGVLSSLHDATRHSGRIPVRLRRDPGPEAALASLNDRLAEAIRAEAFEEAAQLRDEIRELARRVSKEETRTI